VSNKNLANCEKCENCGGNLVFSPTHRALHCFNCGSNSEIIVTNNFSKHPLDYKINQNNINNWKNNNSVYVCQNCGGKVVLSNLELSKHCPYCNTSIVVKTESMPELLPDQIIPFKFDKTQAKEQFKHGVNKKFFLPNKFKKSVPDSEITGFYGSAFSFDADVFVRYHGQLYKDERDSQGRSYRRNIPVAGSLNRNFRNMMIEATNQLTQSQFDKIAPFNLGGAVDYNDSFIRGYGTEYYNNSLQQSYSVVKYRVESQIDNAIVHKHFCDGVVRLHKDIKYSNERFSYLLFPVYKFNYKYKKKDYCTFVNGQTGKVGGGVPRSGAKIGFFVTGIVLGVLGIILLALL